MTVLKFNEFITESAQKYNYVSKEVRGMEYLFAYPDRRGIDTQFDLYHWESQDSANRELMFVKNKREAEQHSKTFESVNEQFNVELTDVTKSSRRGNCFEVEFNFSNNRRVDKRELELLDDQANDILLDEMLEKITRSGHTVDDPYNYTVNLNTETVIFHNVRKS